VPEGRANHVTDGACFAMAASADFAMFKSVGCSTFPEEEMIAANQLQ
jgi:hypothetical protein